MDCRKRASRRGHSDGLSELDRRRLRCSTSRLAGSSAECLPVLGDLGYAIGALSAGLIADWFGYGAAIIGIGAITFVSGAIATVAMHSRIGLENDKP